MGDVKAAAALGTMLAWRGWTALIAGIMDLPVDAPVGESYARWAGLDDPVIEIGVTPNRGDCTAVYGIALLISGHATRKQQIPFGPFMLAGAFAVILAWHGAGS